MPQKRHIFFLPFCHASLSSIGYTKKVIFFTESFLIFVFVLIFGLLVGSFLNVVIVRFEKGERVTGRSYCPSCKKTLSWYELIPLLSYFFLLGRCRSCNKRISFQYPIVEFFSGVLFLLLFLFKGFSFEFFFLLIFFSLLLIIAVYDVRTKIIPNAFVYLLIGLSLFSLFFNFSKVQFFIPSYMDMLSGPLFFIFFASFWYFSKGRAMGLGDGKLALALSWWLPFSLSITAVVISFWIGASISVLLLLFLRLVGERNTLTMKSEVPFAPFLILGFILTFFFNLELLGLPF
ncbi:MAG: prepilin peptidase [Candidatus Paceibacterota bacterium]